MLGPTDFRSIFKLRPEPVGNCLHSDGPQIAYVISDSSFQFRQNGVQFALSLGGDGFNYVYGFHCFS